MQPQPSYLRAVWLQIKASHAWRDITLHSLFGIVAPVVAAVLEFLHSVKHGPATFSSDDVVRPLGGTIMAFLLTLAPYAVFVFLKANSRLYAYCRNRIEVLQARVQDLEAEKNAKMPLVSLEMIEGEPGTLRVTNTGGDTRGLARLRILEITVDKSLHPRGFPIPVKLTFGARWLEGVDTDGYVNLHKNVPHLLRIAELTSIGESNDATWLIHYVERGVPKSAHFTSRLREGVATGQPNRALIAVTLSYQGMFQEIARTYEILGVAFREVAP